MSEPQLPIHSAKISTGITQNQVGLGTPSQANPFGVSQTKLDDQPQKYYGYRVFSRWTGSTEEFLIIRQFSTLNARIILSLQDKISKYESSLTHLRGTGQIQGPVFSTTVLCVKIFRANGKNY
jgi:hypothetical protein